MWPWCNMTQNKTQWLFTKDMDKPRSCVVVVFVSFQLGGGSVQDAREKEQKKERETGALIIFLLLLAHSLHTAVFCTITQCSFLAGRNLRDVPKSGCEGDYVARYPRKSLVLTSFGSKGMEGAVTQASTPASSGFGRTVNEIWTGNFCLRTTHKSVPFIYKRPQKPETGIKNCFQWRNGTRIYHLNILSGKKGLPLQSSVTLGRFQ